MYIALAPFGWKLTNRKLPIVEAGTDRILDIQANLRPMEGAWIEIILRGGEERVDGKRFDPGLTRAQTGRREEAV